MDRVDAPGADPDASHPVPELSTVVGERVRQGRTRLGWTLDQLAARSGVSRRMLVNVERGSANASIATLLRIGDALGVGLPALVDVERRSNLQVIRSGGAPVLWRGDAGGRALLVAGTAPPDVTELWDWTLGPGDGHASGPHATGTRELMLVLAGAVRLQVDGREVTLHPGDSAVFAGDVSHGYANPSADLPARFALTVFEPGVGRGVPG